MRILYVGNINNGHEQKWVIPMAELGHEVHIVSPQLTAEPGKVQVHQYDPDLLYAGKGSLLSFYYKIRDLRKFIKEIKPDILHFQFIVDLAFTAPFLGFKPIILTPWGSDILIFPKRSLKIYWLLKLTLQAAQGITIHSNQIQEVIQKMADLKNKKIARIAYSVSNKLSQKINKREIDDFLRAKGIQPQDRVVLSFRNIMEVYNLEEIILAMARVLKTETNVKFILLYESNIPERVEKIRNLVKEQGILEQTIFVDGLLPDQMFNFYKLAKVGVSFSRSDGCPVSVLESLASRLPLVVSDIPANRQIISQGAIFVKLGDIAGLAEAIKTLLNDSARAAKQIEDGYQDFQKIGFNEDNVQKLSEFYAEFIKS